MTARLGTCHEHHAVVGLEQDELGTRIQTHVPTYFKRNDEPTSVAHRDGIGPTHPAMMPPDFTAWDALERPPGSVRPDRERQSDTTTAWISATGTSTSCSTACGRPNGRDPDPDPDDVHDASHSAATVIVVVGCVCPPFTGSPADDRPNTTAQSVRSPSRQGTPTPAHRTRSRPTPPTRGTETSSPTNCDRTVADIDPTDAVTSTCRAAASNHTHVSNPTNVAPSPVRDGFHRTRPRGNAVCSRATCANCSADTGSRGAASPASTNTGPTLATHLPATTLIPDAYGDLHQPPPRPPIRSALGSGATPRNEAE